MALCANERTRVLRWRSSGMRSALSVESLNSHGALVVEARSSSKPSKERKREGRSARYSQPGLGSRGGKGSVLFQAESPVDRIHRKLRGAARTLCHVKSSGSVASWQRSMSIR